MTNQVEPNIHRIVLTRDAANARIEDKDGNTVTGIVRVDVNLTAANYARVHVLYEGINCTVDGFDHIRYDSTTEEPITKIEERSLDFKELREQAAKQGYTLVPNEYDETEEVNLDEGL